MNRHIEIVAKTFAIVEDKEVIGVVTAIDDTRWSFFPLVDGQCKGESRYIPVAYALEAGLKFERDSPMK